MPPTPERLLSVREVAAQLGVSRATVYGLCEKRTLRAIRVSGAIRISARELAAFSDATSGFVEKLGPIEGA